METPVMEQIAEILKKVWLAKSRTSNRLTEKEQKKLLDKLEAILVPLLNSATADEGTAEDAVDGVEEEVEPSWYGIDKSNDLEIAGDKREEIVQAWAEETGADLNSVLHTQIGDAYFYTYPRIDQPNLELWVVTSEHREELAAALSHNLIRGNERPGARESPRPFFISRTST